MSNYWTRALRSRISRRRALATTTSGAFATAFLIACGGGDDDDDSTGANGSTSGSGATGTGANDSRIAKPVNSTSQAKPGGVFKAFSNGDAIQGLDALSSNHGDTVVQTAMTYSRMLKFTLAEYPNPATQSVEGDVAESYELSPDKLTVTFKLRPEIKWDSRSPTNSRPLDADDILYSWNKFASVHPASSDLAYSADRAPAAAVESVTSPDGKSIVFKLKKPDASLLPLLATWDHLYIMPKEAEDKFDPKQDMRGSGPWMLDRYEPSVTFNYRRNPDYYVKDRPFPAAVERPIIPEYAQKLTQFLAGKVYASVPNSLDVLQTKQDVPELLLMQDVAFPSTTSSYHCTFGYEGDSPFKDVRIRQALSMSVDREAMIDGLYDRDRYSAKGFDMPSARNTILLPGWDGYWVIQRTKRNSARMPSISTMTLTKSRSFCRRQGNPVASNSHSTRT